MSSKRIRLISFTGIILIALIIGASLLLNYFSKDAREIVLPETSEPGSTGNGPSSSASTDLQYIVITKDNVQAVIATLDRSESYSRSIRIENHDETASAVYDILASVRSEAASFRISNVEIKKNVIVTSDKLYVWYEGDKTYYERPVISPEDEKRSSDEYQMIMSYEDVLRLDKNSITDAGYTDSERCIYVEYISTLLQYRTICYVSVDTGLLTAARQYSGDTLIYEMTTSGFDPAEPEASSFDLPDGVNVLNAP